MKPLSELLQSVPGSLTAAMVQKGREMKAAGLNVVNLAAGEPDFDTPRHIQEAAFRAIQAGDTHYPPSHGKPELLEAIVAKHARDNGLTFSPDQILVTPGAKWAIYAALAVLLNPGDEVLVLEPTWVSYSPMIRLHRALPVSVPLEAGEGFRVTSERLRAHVTPRTQLILICSPNNPTGRVFTRAELEAVAQVAQEHDLYVLSDEIYEHIVYDGHRHISPASLPGMAERTVTVNGLSKAYAMTGWRLGWLAAPLAVARLARRYQTQSVTCAASFVQTAAVAALNGPQECVAEMVAAYDARRRFLLDALEEIPGLESGPVEGAFYLFARFTETDRDSLALSQLLLEKGLIATTPGIAFGRAGEGHVRFSFAASMDDLEKAVERLAQIVPQL